MKKTLSLMLFLFVPELFAQELSLKDHLSKLALIDPSKSAIEKQIKKVEVVFFDDLKSLKSDCEQDLLSIRLGKRPKMSKRARLTRKEKKRCLAKREEWVKQFRIAKFDLRKKSLKTMLQDQERSLDRLRDKKQDSPAK